MTLELPAGWPAVRPQRFTLTREDERETFTFEVRPPATPGQGPLEFRAVATDDAGRRYDDRPGDRGLSAHPTAVLVRPASATVRIASLALPPLARIGYVRGAADRVPEALQRASGSRSTLLDAATLERGDLSRYDAIVVGPRAYETDSALVETQRPAARRTPATAAWSSCSTSSSRISTAGSPPTR